MKVEQMYTNCLAEAAYYVESKGEAIIIDPLRETAPYLEKAEAHNAKIKYIFLTHFHADFVSGQLDLANKTGATIVFGPNATAEYDIHNAKDNETFQVGDLELVALHTPGHTMESTSYLLKDASGNDHCIFTGDALFIGDVGRPDLAVKSDLTQADLAGHLFDSLRNKIMTYGDDVIIYPNHGAGSACGKNMSSETWDTLGHQKEVNYALRADMTKEEFIAEVTDGLMPPPQYFPKNVGMNKSVNRSFDEILASGTKGLSPDEIKSLDVLILDTRSTQDFANEHIPGAVFIGIDGSFATWLGTLMTDLTQDIVIVAEEGRIEEVVTRMARVGFDNPAGYLKGGMDSWKGAGYATANLQSIKPEEFVSRFKAGGLSTFDVRKQSEFQSEHIEGVENLPLDSFSLEDIEGFDSDKIYYLHCKSGYRSMIAASLMAKHGVTNIVDVQGGFEALKTMDMNTTEYVCPSTML